MAEMIQKRRFAEVKEERHDLFSSLLDANNDPDAEVAKLTDQELIGKLQFTFSIVSFIHIFVGNIFIFLIAGHEVMSSINMGCSPVLTWLQRLLLTHSATLLQC